MSPIVERKRRARGEARIKSLMEAAELVFARDGYHGATTNEISATAKVSPASLYQFFVNKEALANALTVYYADQLAKIHESMDFNSFAQMGLNDMVSEVLSPLLDFHKAHPAFQTLLLDAPLTKETRAAKTNITEKFIGRLSAMFCKRDPELKKSDADWSAEIFMIVFKGFIPEIHSSSGNRKQRLIEELRAVLVDRLESELAKKL